MLNLSFNIFSFSVSNYTNLFKFRHILILFKISFLLFFILENFSYFIEAKEGSSNLEELETFTEELLIKLLPNEKILNHFHFTTRRYGIHSHEIDLENYNLFPKSLGQIVSKFEVEELHLSFTQGRYDKSWGYPILAAPGGVELWARFKEQKKENSTSEVLRINKLWTGLTFALSGLFCSSLQQMDETMSSIPYMNFQPEGIHKIRNHFSKKPNQNLTRYSILPREPVCTENLTPWKKLLPCRDRAGLSELLSSFIIYDVHFHSMGIHLRSICRDPTSCDEEILELSQTLTLVFENKRKEWTFSNTFHKSNIKTCPLSINSLIYVDHSSLGNSTVKVSTNESSPQVFNHFTLYRIPKTPFHLDIINSKNEKIKPNFPVTAQRYLTDWGQEFGGISVQITNHQTKPVEILYFEMIPWYLKVYYHTLSIKLNEKRVDPFSKDSTLMKSIRLVPAEDRSSPGTIEFHIVLPSLSTFSFSVQFEKAFLHWTEHPSDANRGFDIGSSVVTLILPSDNSSFFNGFEWSPVLFPSASERNYSLNLRIYTENLLVNLPTPDFSMPYNVITLTGTVFALFFGSIFTVLIRRMKNLDREGSEIVSNRPIARLGRRILKFINGE